MDSKIENKIDGTKINIVPIESKDEDDAVVWRSGCFSLNKGFVKFMSSFMIALLLLAFSIYSLVTIDKGEDKSLYISLITLILGVYLPNPTLQ
jgi:hypothetical protein